MSAAQKFRLFFGDRPATQEELAHVEEITVEEETDLAWQATIKMFLCLDERGNWAHAQDQFLPSFQRVRVELQLGERPWVALIDGPIVGRNTDMDSQPGRSNITITVHDDSAFLNREAAVDVRDGRSDDDVARALFNLVPAIAEQRIETPPPVTDRLAAARVRRGTAIQQLRELARRHAFHAFVLPGAQAGRSIGCFLPDPATNQNLPELILLGADRNLSTLQVTEEAQTPTRFRARSLSISDKQIVARTSRLQDLDLLGAQRTQPESQTGTQVLDPHANNQDDPDRAVQAATRRTSYSLRATGRVVPGCYQGVLQPYQLVSIRAGSTALSGSYLLTKATHRLTPSLYTQEFTAKRNGVEALGQQPDVLGGIL
jgi:hypothetical protein